MSTDRMSRAAAPATGVTTPVLAGALASTRAELLRLRRWPAIWVTIGAWLGLAAMFGYLFDVLAYETRSSNFSNEGESRAALLAGILPANVPDVLIQGMPMFGGALMLVTGALVAGSSFGWGVWKSVFTQGPSRLSVVLGSLGALSVFVVGTVIATLVLCLGLSLLVASAETTSFAWPEATRLLRSLGAGVAIMEMWAMLGFLLGTLTRGPALSVGLGLVWALVVENLLRGAGTLLSGVATFTHVLPGTGVGSLVGAVIGSGGPSPAPGILHTLSGGQALTSVIAYAVLAPVISCWLLTRRDVV